MSQVTRRSFVKRTGAMTLGAALGVGVIPSMTRRLRAADLSSQGPGVKMILLTPRWKMKTMAYRDGTIHVGVQFSSLSFVNYCELMTKLYVDTFAEYWEDRDGKHYYGMAMSGARMDYICRNGKGYNISGELYGGYPVDIVADDGSVLGNIFVQMETDDGYSFMGTAQVCYMWPGNRFLDCGMWVSSGLAKYEIRCCWDLW